MQSKTSFCNGTVFRKNMSRFAPLWLLYTLGLLLVTALMYMEDGMDFWFANRMGELIQYSALINLFYAPAAAMLLFGDLYNSRMCCGCHALPLKRSCWYRTQILSGMVFSMLPTGLTFGLSVPLLMNTCVINGWQIALWTFLGVNLTYLCFFGIAVFSAMAVGNRVGMIAVYAILNGGAFVGYFLVDTIYTPMLYGVVTSTAVVELLTPVADLLEAVCLELDSYNELQQLYLGRMEQMRANYHLLRSGWITLAGWAAAGLVFLALGDRMYRRRKLECAGDTVAVKALEPVFQIAVSLCAAAFFSIFIDTFVGARFRLNWKYLFLGCGLLVGWFGGRMLLERTVRVFRLKNFLGLGLLTAVLAGSLAMTHYDVLGLETWTPDPEDVSSVSFGYSAYRGMSQELTQEEDIEAVIRLQQLALEDRLGQGGSHLCLDGRPVSEEEAASRPEDVTFRYVSDIYIHYQMENGCTVSRKYTVWGDAEEAQIVNEYLSRWEVVSVASYYGEMDSTYYGDISDRHYNSISVSGQQVPEEYCTREAVESLLEAIQADCRERTMTQRSAFHQGHFTYVNELGNTGQSRSFWVELYSEDGRSGSFDVFADSENTLKWLKDRGLLHYEVREENGWAG